MKTNLVISIMALMPVALSAGEIVSLGNSYSPVLMALKGSHKVSDGHQIVESIRKSVEASTKDEKRRAQARTAALTERLRQVDAVTADLKELEPGDDDRAVVDAARSAGIPVVFENASNDKMTTLLGLGTDADLVVTEFNPAVAKGRINFTRASFQAQDSSPHQIAITPDPNAVIHPELLRQRIFTYKLEMAQTILRDRPFTNSTTPAKTQTSADPTAKALNNDSGASGVIGVCNEAPSAHQCFEYETQNWNTYYICPYSIDTNQQDCGWGTFIEPQLAVGLYLAAEPDANTGLPNRAILLRSFGAWGERTYYSNDHLENRPFFTSYYLEFYPTNLPTGYSRAQLQPTNANNTTSVTTSTGFSWSVTGTAQSAPSVTGGFGYTSSSSYTSTLSDWSVTNIQYGDQSAAWNYQLANTTNCSGNPQAYKPSDNTTLGGFCWNPFRYWLNDLPDWSTYGPNAAISQPFSEAVWSGTDKTNTQIKFVYVIQATVMDAEVTTQNSGITASITTKTNPAQESYVWTVNPGSVY